MYEKIVYISIVAVLVVALGVCAFFLIKQDRPNKPDKDNSPSTSSYKVTVESVSHGLFTVSKSEAKAGEIITISIIPETGYELEGITLNGVALNSATFTMPERDVKISGLFSLAAGVGAGAGADLISCNTGTYVCSSTIFTDLASNSSFPSYHYFTIKNGNKADIYISMSDDNYILYEDLIYTRNGNSLSATITIAELGDIPFTVNIVNENTLYCEYDEDESYVFTYIPNYSLPVGTYMVFTETNAMPELESTTIKITDSTNCEVTYSNSGSEISNETGTYTINGNQLCISLSESKIYARMANIGGDSYMYDMCYYDIASHRMYLINDNSSMQFVSIEE